jgi:hypothetical protein
MNKKNIAVTIILLTMIVLLIVLGTNWLNKNSNALIVIVTAIYALLTYFILRSNNKHLEETTRPYIVVSLPAKELKIYLSIKNVGKRPACDVKVEFEPALHTIGKGFYDETWSKPLMTQLFMPPMYEVSNLIGTTFEVLNSNTVMPTIKAKISYTDLEKKKYKEEYNIDLSSYIFNKRIVDHNERHYLELISKHLENIHKDISKNG